MKRTGYSHTLPKILFSLLCVAAVAVLFMRIPYGADVTDEAFWIAEPYLLTQGAVPFVNSWSQTPLSSLLIAPLVRLFTAITGETEGIMLFMFRAAFVFRLCIPLPIWLLLRKRIPSSWAAVFCLLLFISDYGGSRSPNYNFVSLSLLALGGALLYNALRQEDLRAAAVRYSWAGVIMAMCALAHAAQLVNCVLFAVFLLLLEHRRIGRLPCWLPYILTGLGVAVVVVIGLEWSGDGGLFSGILLDLEKNNYFRIPHMALTKQFRRIASNGLFLVRLSAVAIPLAGIFALFSAAFCHGGKKAVLDGLMAALLGGGILVCLFYFRYYIVAFQNTEPPSVAVQPVFLFLFLCTAVWFLLLSRQSRKRFLPGFLFFWVSGLSTILLSMFYSHSSGDYRFPVLTCGALFSLPMAAEAIQFHASNRLSRRLLTVLLILLAGAFSASSLSEQYAYVYRDDSIPLLTCRVEAGVYRGLYTTPERATALQSLESQIRDRTAPDETVLFADLMPTAYLMTDAVHCTPTTWDPCHYRYGFQDNSLYQAYFERKGQIPDKIFFINSEGRELSIDDPENAFAAWVRKHYTLAETVGEGLFSFRLFTKNP